MSITKAITWTVESEDGNGAIVMQQRDDPGTFKIMQGSDMIYLDTDSARETYRALGEMLDHADSL